VGLYRSEFLFLTHAPRVPTEQQHYEAYRDIARAVAPHPAVIRTLDLGGEPHVNEIVGRSDGNPVLGLRAIRFCLERRDIFGPQLRGLLRAAVEPNLRILLPLVTEVEELRAVRALLGEQARALRERGVPAREDVPLGVMIEVPAAACAADMLASEADFLSLGTNDLIQYGLALDRGNEAVSYLYRPSHLGLLRMVRFVARAARRAGVPLAVCGEMAADPDLAPLLVGLGLRELSMPPRAIAAVRDAIRATDAAAAVREAARRLRLRVRGPRRPLPEATGHAGGVASPGER
jgi:phosphotransferase system enzyme I (PtsI)